MLENTLAAENNPRRFSFADSSAHGSCRYEAILEILCRDESNKNEGDLLEIGCFLGGAQPSWLNGRVDWKYVWVRRRLRS